MTLKKQALFVLTTLCASPLFANVPIESRGLSQGVPLVTQVALPAGGDAPVQTNQTWQILQKSQQLENDIRILRGKIEEQDNEIQMLKNELSNRYADLDQRFELLQQKVDPAEATSEEDNQQDTAPSSGTSTSESNAVTTSKPSDAERDAYTAALDTYKQGGATKAIDPMKNFIQNHPNSVYISNAHFWLAEFQLGIDPPNFEEAKRNYQITSDKYPRSAKASSALYQLYSIYQDVEQNPSQANIYKSKIMNDYPQSEEAKHFK